MSVEIIEPKKDVETEIQPSSVNDDIMKDLQKSKAKFNLVAEALGLEKGLSIEQIQEKISSISESKKAEAKRIEDERKLGLTETQLLKEEMTGIKTQFNDMLKTNQELEKKASYETLKNSIQGKLVESGIIESHVNSVTKLAMLEHDGSDVSTFIEGFKKNNLAFFKSNSTEGSQYGTPQNNNPIVYNGNIKGKAFGDFRK